MAVRPFSELLSGRRETAPPFLKSRQSIDILADLRRAVIATTKSLRSRKVRRGLLVCEDSGSFVVGLLALLHADAEVLLPSDSREEFIRALDDDFDAVVCDHDLSGIETLPVCEPGDDGTLPPFDSRDARIIFYTSGSTGAPKQAVRRLSDLEHEVRALEENWGTVVDGAPVLAMVPHNHQYGFMFKIAWSLMAGRSICGPTYPTWEELFQALVPNAFILSGPALLQRMAGLETIPDNLRPRFVLTGGAPVEQSAIEEAHTVLGIAPNEAFGSTETGAIAWRDRGKGDIPLSPLPGVDLSEQEGCLVISAPYVIPRQITADRVSFLNDGRFEFLGRGDRVVKVGGKRVNLSGLEQNIRSLSQVENAATIVLDQKRSEIAAVVELSGKGRAELQEVGKFRFERQLRRELSNLGSEAVLPKRWRFADRMPADSLGKPTQQVLVEMFDAPPDEKPSDPVIKSIQIDDNEAKLTLFIPANLKWFDGHFPDYPVLPGVVQLNWAMQFARQHLLPDAITSRQFKVKFRSVVQPDATIDLHLTWRPEVHRLRFEYSGPAGVHTSGEYAMEEM